VYRNHRNLFQLFISYSEHTTYEPLLQISKFSSFNQWKCTTIMQYAYSELTNHELCLNYPYSEQVHNKLCKIRGWQSLAKFEAGRTFSTEKLSKLLVYLQMRWPGAVFRPTHRSSIQTMKCTTIIHIQNIGNYKNAWKKWIEINQLLLLL
jgi:hypothetical protein